MLGIDAEGDAAEVVAGRYIVGGADVTWSFGRNRYAQFDSDGNPERQREPVSESESVTHAEAFGSPDPQWCPGYRRGRYGRPAGCLAAGTGRSVDPGWRRLPGVSPTAPAKY